MKKITKEELKIVLENHQLWLNHRGGECANLSYANLECANLRGANLRSADLSGADLSYANLNSADLRCANLKNANLRKANLGHSNLRLIKLSDADLSETNLNGADLSDTDLRDVDLSCAKLSGVRLSGAKTDKKYLQVDCIGSRQDTTTYCVEDNHVWCGCWNDYNGGTLEEFKKQVKNIYGKKGKTPNEKYYQEYQSAITFFKSFQKNS